MSTEADIVERLTIWPAADGKDGLSSTYVEALMQEAAAEITKLRAERDAASRHKERADLLLAAARSAAVQCGNVIFNCRQVSSSNERHLASWESVQGCLDAAIHLAADTKPATLYCDGGRQP